MSDSRAPAALRPLTESGLADQIAWALVDAAPDGIVFADEAGKILLINRRTEDLFGYDRGELLGRDVDELLPERFRQVHRAHRRGYRAEPRTRPMGLGETLFGLRADGTEFPVEISLSPLHTETGLQVIAMVRDITQRVAADTEARSVRESLEATRGDLRVFEDRDRIARDLHDVVIQRLFAAGLAVQSVQARMPDAENAGRLARVADELDLTIREIRSAIFGLNTDPNVSDGLRAEILRVVSDEKVVLGFEPRVTFEGVIDVVPPEVAAQLLPTLREALSNVGRHAHATSTAITVSAGARMVLRVEDDGVGIRGEPNLGHGLRNVSQRAGDLGGACEVSAGLEHGTVFEWSVPLTA